MPINQAILDSIRSNNSGLKTLISDSEKLTDADVEQLCAALETNTVMSDFILSDNEIGNHGATLLAKMKISMLVLNYNHIGDEGAKALAENTTVTELMLGDNHIGDEGIKALAKNPRIATLHVNNNTWSDDGARALAESTTLTMLNRKGVQLSKDSSQALKSMLRRNRAQADLLLQACVSRNLKEVKRLLDSGVKPYGDYFKKTNEEQNTLLHMVVACENMAVLDLILQYGAGCELNAPNKRLNTPEGLAHELRWNEGVKFFNGQLHAERKPEMLEVEDVNPAMNGEVKDKSFSVSKVFTFLCGKKQSDPGVNGDNNTNIIKPRYKTITPL